MLTYKQAIEILKILQQSARTVDLYEDDIFADYRNMAKYENREIIDTLLSLDLN